MSRTSSKDAERAAHPGDSPRSPRTLRLDALPEPVRELAAALDAAGHAAWLVGESLLDRLTGRPPRGHSLATDARAEAITGLLPRAVPTRASGAGFVVPTAAGPVDLLPLARSDIRAECEARGLRVLALAWCLDDGALLDPFGACDDLRAGRLGTVGPAARALAATPLLALVTARLAACLRLDVEPELERALAALPDDALAATPAALQRREVRALLGAEAPGRGLALLQRSGAERLLGLRTDASAAHVVDALPDDLALRIVAWTAGHGGAQLLHRLRFHRELRERVSQLLHLHPVERTLGGARPAALRRARRRLPPETLAQVIALREAQLEMADAGEPSPAPDDDEPGGIAGARMRLAALQDTLESLAAEEAEAVHRPQLVWRGQDVIDALGIEPGPRVGEALRYLREQIADDPSTNRPEKLAALLARWAAREGAGDEA